MCLHIKLTLLYMLLQLSIGLVLGPGQLQHRLPHSVEGILQCRCIQGYLGGSALLPVLLVQGVLRAWWSSSTRVSRGPPSPEGPPSSGDPPSLGSSPILSGGPPFPSGRPPLPGGLPSLSGYPLLEYPLSGYPLLSGGLPF